jgi:hypothetical protein
MGRVVSRDVDIDVQALAYLVTVMIHRLHESDQAWWCEFQDEMKQARAGSAVGSVKAKVLDRALGIVNDSLRDHSDV